MFTEKHLPAQILLALAKNDATPADIRREIIELLIERNCKEANDPDLRFLVAEIKQQKMAKEEIHEMIESAVLETITVDSKQLGPFKASVTTDTLMQSETIDDVKR